MGYSPFTNCSFQMGVAIMGFAEHFGPYGPNEGRSCKSSKRAIFSVFYLLNTYIIRKKARSLNMHYIMRFHGANNSNL